MLTRAADGIDFNAIFFQKDKQGAVPVLLVQEHEAAQVRLRLSQVVGAAATVVGCGTTTLDTPSTAIEYMRMHLQATRISIECGPSVTSGLYAANKIGALSLSVLRRNPHKVGSRVEGRSDGSIPVIEQDATFQNAQFVHWMGQFVQVSSAVEKEQDIKEKDDAFQWTYDLFVRG